MKSLSRVSVLCLLLLASPLRALGWHDAGHMLVAQIAYLRLTPAAKERVDRLLLTPEGKRPLIHLCAGYYMAKTCEKTYDPVTIATWMDDFRGDSLNWEYDNWHYINYKPFFDGIPVRSNVGPEPVNVLDRINWAVNTLRRGTGRDRTDAETLGYLYHLVGDVHQPLHATTRYTAAKPDGDSGGNGFTIKTLDGKADTSLHFFWDSGGGQFGEEMRRPLDEPTRARLRAIADAIMKEFPEDSMSPAKDLEPLNWIEESNALARRAAYANIREGDVPSPAYTEDARRVIRMRIALAGYRMAGLLNMLFVGPPAAPVAGR